MLENLCVRLLCNEEAFSCVWIAFQTYVVVRVVLKSIKATVNYMLKHAIHSNWNYPQEWSKCQWASHSQRYGWVCAYKCSLLDTILLSWSLLEKKDVHPSQVWNNLHKWRLVESCCYHEDRTGLSSFGAKRGNIASCRSAVTCPCVVFAVFPTITFLRTKKCIHI